MAVCMLYPDIIEVNFGLVGVGVSESCLVQWARSSLTLMSNPFRPGDFSHCKSHDHTCMIICSLWCHTRINILITGRFSTSLMGEPNLVFQSHIIEARHF